MKKIIKKILRLFGLYKTNTNSPLYFIDSCDIPRDEVSIISDNIFHLKEFDLSLNKDTHGFFFTRYTLAKILKSDGASFCIKDERIIAKMKDVSVYIDSTENIHLLNEIFYLNTYNLYLNSNKKNVYMDIGMNLGFASLFFASQENTEKVFGYEPFEDTYNRAVENISLNTSIKDKIAPHNYGIGNEDKTETCSYNPEYTANMSLSGLPSWLLNSDKNKSIEIQIKYINDEMQKILSMYNPQTYNIVLKIDCEGSEYDIFERLVSGNMLNKFDSIMIEWHDQGADKILKHLADCGFSSFSFKDPLYPTGMIYALKASY